MIALIDYRAGNLTSVRKAFAAVGAELYTPERPEDLDRSRGIVVPGVGHFGATSFLDSSWRRAISRALDSGKPLLGICLGLQWLFEGSEEAPDLPGLGILPGRCYLLRPESDAPLQDHPTGNAASSPGNGTRLKVPHVGWNALAQVRPSRILGGVADQSQAYFTHSYVAPITDACVATTTHGQPFASVVEAGRVFGAQFHPEKSSDVGLTLLRNFLSAD
jgi:glutamine amidotransferase